MPQKPVLGVIIIIIVIGYLYHTYKSGADGFYQDAFRWIEMGDFNGAELRFNQAAKRGHGVSQRILANYPEWLYTHGWQLQYEGASEFERYGNYQMAQKLRFIGQRCCHEAVNRGYAIPVYIPPQTSGNSINIPLNRGPNILGDYTRPCSCTAGKCPGCRGRGTLFSRPSIYDGSHPSCQECGGTGICPICDGTMSRSDDPIKI